MSLRLFYVDLETADIVQILIQLCSGYLIERLWEIYERWKIELMIYLSCNRFTNDAGERNTPWSGL